jgi:hypothetical protein
MKISDLDRMVIDNVEEGVFTVHRDVFKSQEIFDLEMKYIFEQKVQIQVHG